MASLPGSAPSGPKPGHQRGSYRHQRGRGPKPQKSEARVRPTHFIAIPLNTNSKLRSRLSTFQSQLLSARDTEHGGWIRGLHPSIAINPIRFHLTIAVMGLQDDVKTGPARTEASGATSTSAPKTVSDTSSVAEAQPEQAKPKTVTEALELLSSLQPKMQEILYGMSFGTSSAPPAPATNPPLRIRLDHMEIMRPVKPPKPQIKKGDSASTTGTVPPGAGPSSVAPSAPDTTSGFEGRTSSREIWADVLYLSPKEDGPEGVKLRQLGDLINLTFRNAGYLTDTRPLKLHCTVLNTSHRKPFRDRNNNPFCYSDILQCEEAWKALFASPSTAPSSQPTSASSASRARTPKPSPSTGQDVHSAVKVQLGAVPHPLRGADVHDEWMEVDVTEIGLWKMGSHAKDGSYVSCGNVKL